MTKRAFPFETHICRQTKIHISNYENDLKALKYIEEQTLKKLMSGWKNLNKKGLEAQEKLDTNIECSEKNQSLKQKCVTNYFSVNGKILNEKSEVINKPNAANGCSFCDKEISCTYQCFQCGEYYCANCSFVNYDSFEDNRICLSCS